MQVPPAGQAGYPTSLVASLNEKSSLEQRLTHTHTKGLQGVVRNQAKHPKRTKNKRTQRKERKGKKEPDKETLTFAAGLKKTVALRGQVEGNEPEVSEKPSNTGS